MKQESLKISSFDSVDFEELDEKKDGQAAVIKKNNYKQTKAAEVYTMKKRQTLTSPVGRSAH